MATVNLAGAMKSKHQSLNSKLMKYLHPAVSKPTRSLINFLNQKNISPLQETNWESYQLKPIIVASIIINILELASPLYINIVYTSILPSESVSSLIVLTVIVVTLMIINGWIKSVRLSLIGDGGARIDHKKRLEAISHFLQIDMNDFFNLSPTQHIQRLSAINILKDESSLQSLITAIDLIFSVLFIIVLFMIGGAVGFAAIGGIAIYLFKAFKFSKEYEEISRSRDLIDLQTRSFHEEVIEAADLIKANGLQQKMIVESEIYQDRRAHERMRQNQQSGIFQAFGSLTGQLTFSTGITLGAFLVITDNLSVGALAASILLLGKILTPWQQAMNLLNSYRRIAHSRDEYKSLMSIPITSKPGKKSIGDWHYIKINRNKDIAITAEEGEIILIKDQLHGENTRHIFLEIAGIKQSNGLLINDINVEEISSDHLKEYIAYIDPSRSFFKGTLLENLTGFQFKKNRRLALFWSMLSGLDEEVRKLPDGYNTQMNDTTSNILSRDTEAIAHIVTALSQDPKLIMIDLSNYSYGKQFVDRLEKILKRCKLGKIVLIGGGGPVFSKITKKSLYLQETSKEVLQ